MNHSIEKKAQIILAALENADIKPANSFRKQMRLLMALNILLQVVVALIIAPAALVLTPIGIAGAILIDQKLLK